MLSIFITFQFRMPFMTKYNIASISGTFLDIRNMLRDETE